MKKQLVLIVLAMCMIPVLTSAIIVEYSTDNSTWTNCTFTNSTSKTGYQLFLDPGTLYYFRASNDGYNWNYTTATTEEGFDQMELSLIVAVGIIAFLFMYLAMNLDKEHFILKLLLIFFALASLFLLPAGIINGEALTAITLMKVFGGFFAAFFLYFFVYIIWHWAKKNEDFLRRFK